MPRQTRVYPAIILAGLAVAAAAAPADAQGFFDQLFGRRSVTPTEAPPVYSEPSSRDLFPDDFGQRIVPPQRAVVEAKPVLQKPTDLMHDKTLQVGDAVMMADGIHVYNGPETVRHNKKQFVPLDRAELVVPATRIKLAALEGAHREPVREGRSISGVVTGFKVTDARGNSIRYVGP